MIYDDNGSNTFFAIISAFRIDLYDYRMRNILKIYYDAHLLFYLVLLCLTEYV